MTLCAASAVVVTQHRIDDEAPALQTTSHLRAADLPAGEIRPPAYGERWQLTIESKLRLTPSEAKYYPAASRTWYASGMSGDMVIVPCNTKCSFRTLRVEAEDRDRQTAVDETGVASAVFVRKGAAYEAAWSAVSIDDCGQGSKVTRRLKYRLVITPDFDGPDDFGVKAKLSGFVSAPAKWAPDKKCYYPATVSDLRRRGRTKGVGLGLRKAPLPASGE
jgi:hypothetical protein